MLLQQDWFKKTIIGNNFESLSKSALYCHFCYVILDGLSDLIRSSDPKDLENLIDLVISAVLKPFIHANPLPPESLTQARRANHEATESDSPSRHYLMSKPASASTDHMERSPESDADGYKEDENKVDYDQDRGFYGSKEVRPLQIDIELLSNSSSLSSGSFLEDLKSLGKDNPNQAKLVAKFEVVPFQGKRRTKLPLS